MLPSFALKHEKEEILTWTKKKILSKFCVWLHQIILAQERTRTMSMSLISMSLISATKLINSASTAECICSKCLKCTHTHRLSLCFTFRFHSFLWIYFCEVNDKIEGRIKQWWLRIRCNFGCVYVSNVLKPLFISEERVETHNRINRNYLHRNSASQNLYLVYYVERKFTVSSVNACRSRLRFVQMEIDFKCVFLVPSSLPTV